MTSLFSWAAIDPHGSTSAVYLASDSRISWSNNQLWDCGRKLFASKNYPEILGYCGDVLFLSQVLAQIIEHIDAGLLVSFEDPPQVKFKKITSLFKKSFSVYPNLLVEGSSIIYCTYNKLDKKSTFHIWTLTWTKSRWQENALQLPSESGLIAVLGSGKTSVEKWYTKWNASEIANTSRIAFAAFCDALKSNEDPQSGGAPQLVGIYRSGVARSFGVIYKNERYLFGLPVSKEDKWEGIEWRNELFERCEGITMSILDGAQHHARPTGIS